MLRVTVTTTDRKTSLKVEGKLVGLWVAELERCWHMTRDGKHRTPVVIDLSAVTFVDAAGKELIRRMWATGAELVVTGPLMTSIVNEIRAGSGQAGPQTVAEAS